VQAQRVADTDLDAYVAALRLMDQPQLQWGNTIPSTVPEHSSDDLEWLFDSPEFKNWVSDDYMSMLWLGGKSIAENTHAMDLVLQWALTKSHDVFFAFHEPAASLHDKASPKTEAESITRALLRQVLEQDDRRLRFSMEHYPLKTINKPVPHILSARDWELRHLIHVLFTCLVAVPKSTTCVLIDGIDVMGTNAERFLGQLQQLLEEEKENHPNTVVKIFFTSTTRNFQQPPSESEKELAKIPYIEKDKEIKGTFGTFKSVSSIDP
jgi:hypothetical protein